MVKINGMLFKFVILPGSYNQLFQIQGMQSDIH